MPDSEAALREAEAWAMNSASWASYQAAAELPDRDDDCQPSYTCDHCNKRAKKAVAITLQPWDLSDTRVSAGWLCGECADELRVWLGDEEETPDAG